MQPILSERVEYATKMLGIGKKATACLYQDRIILFDANNQPIQTIMFAQLTQAVKAFGMFRFKTGDQLHILSFWPLPYRFFGLAGYMLSRAGPKSEAWANQLAQMGMRFEKKFF